MAFISTALEKKYTKNSLNYKIAKSFYIIALLCAVESAILIFALMSSKHNIISFYTDDYQLTHYLMQTNKNICNIQKSLYEAVQAWDSKYWSIYAQKIKEDIWTIDDNYHALLKTYTKEELSGYYSYYEEAIPLIEEVLGLSMLQYDDDATDILINDLSPLLEQSTNEISILLQSSETHTQSLIDKQNFTFSMILLLCILAMVAVITALLILGTNLSKTATTQLSEVAALSGELSNANFDLSGFENEKTTNLGHDIVETARILSSYIAEVNRVLSMVEQGNFNITSSIEYKGDFVSIRDSLEAITDSFNYEVSQIKTAADTVKKTSEQFTEVAGNIARGNEAQITSTATLLSMASDLKDSIGLIIKSMADTNDATENMRELVRYNSRTIEAGSKTIATLEDAINQIVSSSSKIGAIAANIQEITTQTNMLAINASIESARSSSSDKDFSVVASEIRKLADVTAAAAIQITSLIDDSIVKIQRGKEITLETISAINKSVEGTEAIIKDVDHVAQIVKEINDYTIKQETAVKNIFDNVNKISSMAETNSHTSKECSDASKELIQKSEVLFKLVANYKLSEKHLDNSKEA